MADEWGKLDVAMVPPITTQEAQAESQELAGRGTVHSPGGSGTVYDVPKVPASPSKEVDAEGGDSHQVPWQGPSEKGAGGDTHYFIHQVIEEVERGFAGFNSIAWTLQDGVPTQILGLDDLRPRANLVTLEIDADTTIYVGNRDVIDGSAPQTSGVWLASQYATWDYRARKELWAVAVGGSATLGVTSYQNEPTSGTLGSEA